MRKRRKGLNFRKPKKKFNEALFKEILIWAGEIVAVMLLGFVLVYLFGMKTTVIGQSMNPTLRDADQVLVNRFVYSLRMPKIGEVIVFLPNGNEKSHYYVKRVVAGAGDKVQIKSGVLYVNGEPSNTVSVQIADPGIAAEEIKLDVNEFFVLGDNLSNSEDSRYANVGIVKRDYIIGKVWYRFNPYNAQGFIN